jgi:hypothetical protein
MPPMTFAVRAATATYSNNSTVHAVTLPASIAAGHVLLITIWNVVGETFSTPAGWTLLASTSTKYWFKRTADGSEGATVDITASGAGSAIAISERWTGASGNVEAAVAVASLDVPSLTPSWGAKDTVWVTSLPSAIGIVGDDDSVPPTNYANPVELGSGFVGIMSAYRELNAISTDPGSWTQPEGNAATTLIAIEPEGGAAGNSKNILLLGVG